MAEPLTATATEFKQHVGKYLDAARTTQVIIERQGRPTAVLISVEEYERLNPAASKVLDTLGEEFDALVAEMQSAGFAAAMDEAFEATPKRLGAAHRRGAKRRGR
jgi:prevent-host-death family protein